MSVPYSTEEADILPGVPDALSELKADGYWLFVVTNQPEVARGTVSRFAVDVVNDFLLYHLRWIDNIRTCYHDNLDGCDCRKPKPGLITALMRDSRIDSGFMIGDRWRDIEAGRRANLSTVFVDNGYDEEKPTGFDARVYSLQEAAGWILEHGGKR